VRAGVSVQSLPIVVCGVEDARTEKTVVTFAAELAKRCGGRLVIVHTQPPPLIQAEPQIAYAAPQLKPARDLVASARELARVAADAGVAARAKLRLGFGDPAKRLLATARREHAALLVVGSKLGLRRGAMHVIGDAPCPVVVVPIPGVGGTAASARSGWGRERMVSAPASSDAVPVSSTNGGDVTGSILCGVDGSRHAPAVLRQAGRLAAALGVPLVVAHVVQPPLPSPGVGLTARQLPAVPIDALMAAGEATLDKLLDEEGLGDVERRVVLGFPADRLADLADDEGAELIVVGSRGRGAVKAALLGSVSTALIGVARCPVLVVPPGAEPPSGEPAQSPAASLARAA